ncbi:ORC-CDC6 family AAA ATPase [Mesoterricola silvestris]|uniref:Uncharacterized protein n=1 Tax=Mesoterricola silvestris TaxID=2927979 RepID=A0AA48GUE9_9BACT|nr:hypothetical protein [Mesoterricola silvestris]BDU74252.1 hypothetical protein METEAL_34260 [Mesoterricola silvestris]
MSRTLKHPDLYPLICKLSPRAEKLDKDVVTKAFVDAGYLQRILCPTTQFVEGRRGTGKSHLFLYLNDYVNTGAAGESALSAYIDSRDIKQESGQDEAPSKEYASRFFRKFLQTLLLQLRVLDASVLLHNEFTRANTGYDLIVKRRSAEALDQIEKCIQGKKIETSRRFSENKKTLRDVKSKRGIELNLLTGSVLPSAKLEANSSNEFQNSENSDVSHSYEIVLDFSSIRDSMESFLKINDISIFYILIDEWSSVPLPVQPYFAEYIKRCFSPSSFFSVKIAILPFQTKFSDMKGQDIIGFEKTADIFAAIDLDGELLYGSHPEPCRVHMTNLLFKHLKHIAETYYPKSTLDIGSNPEKSISQLLNPQAIERMLVFSQGNSRDFLQLFQASFIHHYNRDHEMSDLINSKDVEIAAKELGAEKVENLQPNRDAYILFNSIIHHVLQVNRKHAFILDSKFQHNPLFAFLVHNRALHVWDKSYSSPSSKGKRFLVVAIDQAIIVEHLKSPSYRKLFGLPFTEEQQEELKSVSEDSNLADQIMTYDKPDKRSARYVALPEEIFVIDQTKTCPNCQSIIDQNHPVYKKANLCPKCGELIQLTLQG